MIKRKMARVDVNRARMEVRLFSTVVGIAGSLKGVSSDPKDDMVLECAVAGNATHTRDKKHLLPIGRYQGVEIVSPAEFIALNRSMP